MSGIVVGYLLSWTIFMILLILSTGLIVCYRKKMIHFHSITQKVKSLSLNNQKPYIKAIINGTKHSNKEQIKVVLSSEIVFEIEEYCRWARIDNLGLFIEEAACFIFEKDKDWKDYQRAIKRAKKQELITA